MKKTTAFRSLLGLTQHEMAMLLGVSRSRLAMYESGQRELPGEALPLLADFLSFYQAAGASGQNKSLAPQQQTKMVRAYQRRLQEIEYELAVLAKRQEALRKKAAAHAKRSLLLAFLNSQKTQNKTIGKGFERLIAANGEEKSGAQTAALATCELKMELLAFEKSLLESKTRKITQLGHAGHNDI